MSDRSEFAQPSCQISVSIVASSSKITITARHRLKLAHSRTSAFAVPVANVSRRYPSRIDERKGSTRERSSESFVFACASETVHNSRSQIFGRIRADRRPLVSFAHSPLNFSRLRAFRPAGFRRCSCAEGAGESAACASAARFRLPTAQRLDVASSVCCTLKRLAICRLISRSCHLPASSASDRSYTPVSE